MIDIHSHILPEIDDGSKSFGESIEMARIASQDGITHMVCTPHMFNGLSNNPDPAEVVERVQLLRQSLGKALDLLPGNEVHFTHDIVNQVKLNRVTRLNQRNYMLVEFPTMNVPVGAEEALYQIQVQGVRPILVHPERNFEIQNHPDIVAKYVDRGVLIQVTAMSITGEFGPAARTCVDRLLRHNCVHFIATDTHRSTRRLPILSAARDTAAELIGADRARRLVEDNPLAVIRGDSFEMEDPIPFEPQKKVSFFSRFFG